MIEPKYARLWLDGSPTEALQLVGPLPDGSTVVERL
jgi:hypothetical protein